MQSASTRGSVGLWVLTVSSISRVCAAETQNRARASARGVAGNPTTTTPIFLFNRCLAKALWERQKRRLAERRQNYVAGKRVWLIDFSDNNK